MAQTRIIGKDWFIYPSQSIQIASGDSDTDTINIQAGSDFMLHSLSYVAFVGLGNVTEGTREIPLISLQLTDTGSSQQLFGDQIPLSLMFGTGERIYNLPFPRRFRANTTLTVNFLNFSAATTYDIYLAFHGVKVFTDS